MRMLEILRLIFGYRTSCIGAVIIIVMTFVAIAAGVIAPKHYAEVDIANRLKPPAWQCVFGTDTYGRDVFSRVVYGTRIALWVGLLVVLVETSVGISLGLIAGYYGGVVDKVISGFTDLTWALPPVVLALAVITLIGPGLTNVVAAIALVSWPPFTRVVRAKTSSLKEREFILAAKSIGESSWSIIFRYLLPNIVPSIIVLMTLTLPSAILSTTALSFLGFGAQPPTPDWGAMLSEGAAQLRIAPWVSTFPGIFIVVIALGFNLLGDGLRDILDPKLKI